MELYFNELSIAEKENINRHEVIALADVYRELRKHEITTCRISHEDHFKLHQMIQGVPEFLNVGNFYFSFFRSPYESETVEKGQNEYLEHEWSYNGKICYGLPLAVILNSAVLSISDEEWNKSFICISKDDSIEKARNICTGEQVTEHIPLILAEQNTELVESTLRAEDKKISLRDDHGKDVLMDFSKRLIRCSYVEGVINSLPFNSHERKFIRKICEDGLIEIVLPWTDKGYGLVAKTTGRTKNETKRIAELIEDKYGKI